MSKFLYPIYKLKTKSYIKWWLYHKKAGGSGILSEILEGFSFNLENTLNRKFNLFEIQGHSEQESTTGKQLLNENNLSNGYNASYSDKVLTTGSLNTYAVFALTLINKNMTINPGTTYYIKFKAKLQSGTCNNLNWFKFFNRTNNVYANATGISNPALTEEYKDYAFSNTVDADFNVEELMWQVPAATSAKILVKDILISTDPNATYEPYTGGQTAPSPSYPFEIHSTGDNVNLFDKNSDVYNAYLRDYGWLYANDSRSFRIPCQPNTDYCVSIKEKPNVFRLALTSSDSIPEQGGDYIPVTNEVEISGISYTFKTLSDTKYIIVQVSSATVDVSKSTLKLEKGTVASPYTSYGMGSVNEKVQNKNLFDGNNPIYTTNKILNDNGVEITDNSGGYTKMYIKVKPNVTYTISGLGEAGSKRIYYFDKNKKFISRTASKVVTSMTFATPENCYYVDIQYYISGNDFTKYQLEQGAATDYVAHEEQDYSIPTQQPMRSIGDVRDCFVKKSDGWYERHMPYIASYNGETLPQDVYNEVDNVKYCNEKSMSTTGQFSIGASVQYIDENNWNDLPCTETQIQQLENLPSTYKDFTIIQSQDETPAYLKIQYYKEG